MTDEEIKALQADILNKEAEIKKLQSQISKGSQTDADLKKLQSERDGLASELAELKAKFWDGKNRRAKERRTVSREDKPRKGEDDDGENAIGGPFA